MKTLSCWIALASSALALAACNPCASPTVATSSVFVSDGMGGVVPGVQVTATNANGTVTFNCAGGAPTDAGTSSDSGSAGPVPDASSADFAPRPGTQCTFAGGLGNGPFTVRATAPGFVAAERVVTMSELTQPTGCGFALSITLTLTRM